MIGKGLGLSPICETAMSESEKEFAASVPKLQPGRKLICMHIERLIINVNQLRS